MSGVYLRMGITATKQMGTIGAAQGLLTTFAKCSAGCAGHRAKRALAEPVAHEYPRFARPVPPRRFEESAKKLFKLVHDAQTRFPGKQRHLYIDIEGHRNSKGGFDSDMVELQQEFLFGSSSVK